MFCEQKSGVFSVHAKYICISHEQNKGGHHGKIRQTGSRVGKRGYEELNGFRMKSEGALSRPPFDSCGA